jgi:hypothetical protein
MVWRIIRPDLGGTLSMNADLRRRTDELVSRLRQMRDSL